jgi:hypothetical protein
MTGLVTVKQVAQTDHSISIRIRIGLIVTSRTYQSLAVQLEVCPGDTKQALCVTRLLIG